MRIYKSPLPRVENIPKQSLFAHLLPSDDTSPNSVALIDASTTQTLTRGQLRAQALQLAYGLQNSSPDTCQPWKSIPQGSTIMIFSKNSPYIPVVMFAGLAAGITVSLASSASTPSELVYQIEDSAPVAIFVQPALLSTVVAALVLMGMGIEEGRPRIVLLSRSDNEGNAGVEGILTLEDLMHTDKELVPEAFDEDQAQQETALIYYSSGTTGLPKGVELTHYGIISVICMLVASPHTVVNPGQVPVAYSAVPMCHVFGSLVMLWYPLARKTPCVITPGFEPVSFLQAIERYKITHLYIAPPIAAFLAHTALLDRYNITSLRAILSSAAPLSAELNIALRRRLAVAGAKDIHIAQALGITEMSPDITITPHGQDHKPLASGVLLGNIEARLLDNDGRDVPEGEPGELVVRGPNVMKGYLNKPEETRNTINHGWLYTGDIATIDDEGFVTIVDRKKELIKYKGFQVSPVELEDILLSHSEVIDAAVVGIQDPKTGNELPRAYIVPRDPHLLERPDGQQSQLLQADIERFMQDRVSHYKKLRGGVQLIKGIPKSPSGKILRRQLRSLINVQDVQFTDSKL